MKSKFTGFFIALMLLSGANGIFAQTKIIPFQELPTSSGSPSGSNMFFGASMTTSSITVTFEGPVNRWIAFGLGTFMAPADVFIFSDGHSFAPHALGWRDYFNANYNATGVTNDATQNWNVISTGTNSAGQRTVTATRALSTGDGNDIAVTFSASALNLIWARGASAGFGIAYHGSNDRASNIVRQWHSPPTASFSTVSNTVCQGSPITYSNLTTGGQTTYTWTFQGGTPATSTSTNPVVSYSVPGTYSVTLVTANAAGTSTYSQPAYITVTQTVVPSATITLTSPNPICQGATAMFTSTVINGGLNPTYQWKVNGVNAGNNSPTFTTSTLANSSQVSLVILSNAACVPVNTATSSVITVTVNSNAPATVTIAALPGSNPICTGDAATFTATPGNGGSAPSYQWKVNGVNAGINSATFTSTSLVQNDVVTVVVTSNATCASQSTGTVSGITMTVSTILIPAVSTSFISGNNPSCEGTALTLSASPVNGGNAPTYQWKINGNNTGSNTPTLSTSFTNGAVVSVVLTSNFSCASPPNATSTAVTLTINPLPVVTISQLNTLCTTDILPLTQGSPAGGTYSGTGVSGTNFDATQSGAGSFQMTYSFIDSNGCASTASTSVKVEECVAIKDVMKPNSEISLYPNPVSSHLTVDAMGNKITNIFVKDLFGKTVLIVKASQETKVTLNLSSLADGNYFIDVLTEQKMFRGQISLIK